MTQALGSILVTKPLCQEQRTGILRRAILTYIEGPALSHLKSRIWWFDSAKRFGLCFAAYAPFQIHRLIWFWLARRITKRIISRVGWIMKRSARSAAMHFNRSMHMICWSDIEVSALNVSFLNCTETMHAQGDVGSGRVMDKYSRCLCRIWFIVANIAANIKLTSQLCKVWVSRLYRC